LSGWQTGRHDREGSLTDRARRGRPPRTPEQRAEQRARLVGAAMEAVRRHGPDVSIDRVAAEAEASKPVLYAEFGDKLGIADAVATVLADRVEADVLTQLTARADADLDHAVRALVDALMRVIDAEPTLYRFLVRSIRTSDRGLLDNALARTIRYRAALLVDVFAPGIDPGEVQVLIDGAFGFVLASLESWEDHAELGRGRLAELLTAAISEGLRAAARLPAPR
jgi:AcrR family transcriptional regulator